MATLQTLSRNDQLALLLRSMGMESRADREEAEAREARQRTRIEIRGTKPMDGCEIDMDEMIEDRPHNPGQANEHEIEVTPEMVEAGVFELSNHDPESDNGYEFVKQVFRTMTGAKSDSAMDGARREAFKVIEPSGKTYRCYEDGGIDGFEEGSIVVDRIPSLMRESHAKGRCGE